MITVKDKKTAYFYALNPARMGLFQLSTENPAAAVAWGEITGKNEEQKKSATTETKFLPTQEWILYSLKSILTSSTANTNYKSTVNPNKLCLGQSSSSNSDKDFKEFKMLWRHKMRQNEGEEGKKRRNKRTWLSLSFVVRVTLASSLSMKCQICTRVNLTTDSCPLFQSWRAFTVTVRVLSHRYGAYWATFLF